MVCQKLMEIFFITFILYYQNIVRDVETAAAYQVHKRTRDETFSVVEGVLLK